MNPRALLSLVASAVLFVAGCADRSPLEPESAVSTTLETQASDPNRGFYPLGIGSEWRYDYRADIHFVPIPGGTPMPPESEERFMTHELTGTEVLFGRTYVVERQRTDWPGFPPAFAYVRYRQDGAGLYEADVPPDPPGAGPSVVAASDRSTSRARLSTAASSDVLRGALLRAYDRIEARRAVALDIAGFPLRPAARPSDGVLPGEIQRLAYRLRPGVSWTIRPDPLYTSTVETRERITLRIGSENAFRIRIDSELFGENDRVHTWYSAKGLLLLVAHFEEEATDEQGNVLGRLIADDRKEVTFVELAH